VTSVPAVSLRGATLSFGARTLWESLDLDVASGEFIAVLGPNGAGKTSLMRVLLGLQALSAGSVLIGGQAPRRGATTVGYVPQQRGFDRDLPLRGRDLVRLGGGCRCRPDVPASRSPPRSPRSTPRASRTPRSACCPAGSSNGYGSPRLC
jgi:ABC-type Mn2+/Zn2+ transport system ATPase subunit